MRAPTAGKGNQVRRRVVHRLAGAGILAAMLATVVSFFGQLYWLPELFTHFRLQLAVGCVVLALTAAAVRSPRGAFLAAVLVVVNLSFLAGYLWPQSGDARAQSRMLRIMSANVGQRNRDYAAMRELIMETQPDVIGLIEVDEQWVQGLDEIASSYPHRIARPEPGTFGLVLLSKLPLRELEQSPYVYDGIQTAIFGELEIRGGQAKIALAHVHAPTSPYKAYARNRQLASLASMFRTNRDLPGILVGDLNITPWSPHYAVLEADTGMKNAGHGKGYIATWPTSPWILRIPIDHCLLTETMTVETIRTGPAIGSDHLPLIVDIGVSTL